VGLYLPADTASPRLPASADAGEPELLIQDDRVFLPPAIRVPAP
jgi:hypothetical protein